MSRPSEYKPHYCEIALSMGKQGKSWTQVAAEIGIAKSTLYLWKAEYPEFSDALEASRTFAQSWWENMGQSQMIEPVQGFSASLWAKQVSCRFADDYTDKQKQEISGGTSLEIRFVDS